MGEQVAARYSLPVSSTNEKGIPTENPMGLHIENRIPRISKTKRHPRPTQEIVIGTQVVNKERGGNA